jgi:hypothetical protein
MVVHSHNGILHINEKKCSVTTYNNVDESHKLVEQNESDTKERILYYSVYIKF